MLKMEKKLLLNIWPNSLDLPWTNSFLSIILSYNKCSGKFGLCHQHQDRRWSFEVGN